MPRGKTRPKSCRATCTALSLAGIALLLAACSTASGTTSTATGTRSDTGTPSATSTPAAAELHGSYVALGDSYAAGLDIPDQTGATAGCGQSTSSYPFLVARSLRLDLTDMSCSSATIASLTAAEPAGDGTNPAQLSALSATTALVTLGIGGNDVGWTGIITRCTEMDLVPALTSGDSTSDLTPCQDYYTSGGTNMIQQNIQTVAGQLADALTQIRRRAPRARVYVVGYPDLLPGAGGACADTLGITKGDIAFLNNEELLLNGMLRHVAQAAGDGYINTYTPSEGHDACSPPASRWIEPLIPAAPAAPLHPNAVGEQGMADTIIQDIKAAALACLGDRGTRRFASWELGCMIMAGIVLRVRLIGGDQLDVKFEEPDTADPDKVAEHVIAALAQDSGVLRAHHGDRLVVLFGRGVAAIEVAPRGAVL